MKLAFHHASRAGRQLVESSDLFVALFEESRGPSASVPVAIIRQHGVEPDALVSRIATRMRDHELREEQFRKRFELPPFLRNFATNLNLLARQDRIPPVFGRDAEIQQVLEVLSHRERSNSVMLVGEPGVGKTAIVEGLARRIEFEPDTIPSRLRDCQIVNLQMNSIVAGTMLRGMFEDRLHNVIREVKERPNLVLFVDEAHTMVGAGSAIGAPADAANIFKSVLSRGEVRIIGATTRGEYKEYIQEDEALARRFRVVNVPEPTIEETRRILNNLKPRLERLYSVRMLDEAIDAALDLSPRYERHLRLPDKVIGWLDTASVRTEIDKRWEVTAADVVDVVSHTTGIPKDMVFRDVGDRLKGIEQQLGKRVIGQEKAVEAVARRLVLNKGPLKDGFDRPDGVLLFLGPTGVGKTELAKAVAEFLFGDEKKMIRVDMSEYQDGGLSVDKLIGMPRGIVGSERGGILTNQLRDNPCSVVLLDEVEKASPTLLNLFLQAFDEGWLTDGRGKRVYLSDAIVIMTSNAGLRALPQAGDQPRIPLGPRGDDAGAERDSPRAGAPLQPGVPQPHRPGGGVRSAHAGSGAGDHREVSRRGGRDAAPVGQVPGGGAGRGGRARGRGLQHGQRRALPEARDRRPHQAAAEPEVEGSLELPRAGRGRRNRRGADDAAAGEEERLGIRSRRRHTPPTSNGRTGLPGYLGSPVRALYGRPTRPSSPRCRYEAGA